MCPSDREPLIETASCGRNVFLTPIVNVQRLERLLRIREVPGSISDRRQLSRGPSCCSSVLPGKSLETTSRQPTITSNPAFINYPTTRAYAV